MEQKRIKNRKLPFKVTDLAKFLHLSRITLYKYFDLFDSLKEKLNIAQNQTFNQEDIAKVLDQTDVRLGENRIEFLNHLSKFYWDSLNQRIDSKFRFDKVIYDYVPSSLIEKNIDAKVYSTNFIEYKQMSKNQFAYEDLHRQLPLKEFELMKEFGEFIKENKNESNKDVKYEQLITYIQFLRFQSKKGK